MSTGPTQAVLALFMDTSSLANAFAVGSIHEAEHENDAGRYVKSGAAELWADGGKTAQALAAAVGCGLDEDFYAATRGVDWQLVGEQLWERFFVS